MEGDVKPLYIRKKLCSIEEIADSLKDLVSGKYDAKAQEVSQRIRKENGVVTAADAIEKYVLEKSKKRSEMEAKRVLNKGSFSLKTSSKLPFTTK